jgi:hypothetical protein
MVPPEIERWKKYLRFDPSRWLLASDDPSIQLWYQLDIARRPEDAIGVMEVRERVLYSDTVQTLFAAQADLGYWGNPESLTQPYYRATAWSLALLTELGIPRSSRRARLGCEFALANFMYADGSFADANAVESGYLLRALGYFMARDRRVLNAARALGERTDTADARFVALWSWRPFLGDAEIAGQADETLERVLDESALASEEPWTFPQFEPRDPLFRLRVLAEYDRVTDSRVSSPVEQFIAKQDAQARWTLERDLNRQLAVSLERAGEPSRWLTLNALRVIVKLVLTQ